MRGWALAGLLACAASAAAQGTAGQAVDPLQRPGPAPGAVSFGASFGYTPSGHLDLESNEQGEVGVLMRQGHAFSATLSSGYSVSPRLNVHANMTGRFDVTRKTSELNASTSFSGTASWWSGTVGASQRLAPAALLDPRLNVSLSYPWSVTTHVTADVLRDPVVVSGFLGAGHVFHPAGTDLLFGMNAWFVANERVTLAADGAWRVPLADASPPTVLLGARVGYTLDPEFREEVGVRSLVTVGLTTTVGVELTFSRRD